MGMKVLYTRLTRFKGRPVRIGRGRAMRGWDGLEAQSEIGGQSSGIARVKTPGCHDAGPGSSHEELGYRGSWAEQRVVARLAAKRTRKATRITTTPPTVRRSQRSELSRASNSRFPVITNVLIHSFTGPKHDCSDQGHKRVFCRSRRQRGVKDPTIFIFGFREREGLRYVYEHTHQHGL